jgi:hypothetical protein
MRHISLLLLPLLIGAPSARAEAKPPSPPSAHKKAERPPPPGDKRTNEGAQGRTNATEDASRSVQWPNPQRLP